MLKFVLEQFRDIPNLHEKVNAVSDVINNRPIPLRKYDQIYMKAGDITFQAEIIQSFIRDKKVLFMGDGDGMALTLSYLSSLNLLQGPKSSIVLDFDERIVNSIKRFAKEFNLNIDAYLYNVVDPLPSEFIDQSDFFYTNPPYGSSNNGRSVIIFIDRCLEACVQDCSGCVIIPYDRERTWTQTAMYQIQAYAIEVGLVVRGMLCELHSYHLDDDPNLLSSVVIFDRLHEHPIKFRNSAIPPRFLENFYNHESQDIPHYIRQPDNFPHYYEDKEWG